MSHIYAWDDIVPVIDPTAFVHDAATVIGDVIVGPDSHVGHGAVLHGCHIGENALIGMNAVVMDKARIGENCIVGALSFVKAGAVFAPGLMIAGSPARILRELSAEEIDWKRRGTRVYQSLARMATGMLRPARPLEAEEEGRRRVRAPGYDPLVVDRLTHPADS